MIVMVLWVINGAVMQCHFAHAQQEVWKQSWHYWDNFYFQKVKTTHWVHRTTCFRHLWAQSRRRHICLSLRVFLSPCKDMRDCILALSVAVQAYGGPVSTWWTGNIRLYIAFLLSGPFYFCVSFSVKHLVAVVVLMWNWCKYSAPTLVSSSLTFATAYSTEPSFSDGHFCSFSKNASLYGPSIWRRVLA